MSNKQNYRRGEISDRTEHGSRWENGDNSHCCNIARKSWKRLRTRAIRRNPDSIHNKFHTSKHPDIVKSDDE